MDTVIKDKALAIMRMGRTRTEATDWLRVTLGLYYLGGLMKEESIDFRKVDREYNKVIYQALGPGLAGRERRLHQPRAVLQPRAPAPGLG